MSTLFQPLWPAAGNPIGETEALAVLNRALKDSTTDVKDDCAAIESLLRKNEGDSSSLSTNSEGGRISVPRAM